MTCCRLSHQNSCSEMLKGKPGILPLPMEIFAVFTHVAIVNGVIAKVLKSDVKVAALVGAVTSISDYTFAIIDHRYSQDDNKTHSQPYRIARCCATFFVNLQVVRYFSLKGRTISYFWALATPATLAYFKELELFTQRSE